MPCINSPKLLHIYKFKTLCKAYHSVKCCSSYHEGWTLHEGWSSYDNCHGNPGKRYGYRRKTILYTGETHVKNNIF
jgi:hypothetical protein